MIVLSFFKDIILDYAINVMTCKDDETAKNNLKSQLIRNLNELRDCYPELLFVNYNTEIDKELANQMFRGIKERVKEKFSISLLPDTLFIEDNIKGDCIQTPTFITLQDGGCLLVKFDSPNQKKTLLNQLLIHLTIQLPIKKIEYSFVDLMGRYEEDFFLKNFNPILYRNRPITSEHLLEELLDRIEVRRLEVAKKYGDYPKYCELHKEIPLPYEFIVLLDDHYANKYHQRLNTIVQTGHKYGVYVILFKNSDSFVLPEKSILDPNGKQIYQRSNIPFCSQDSQPVYSWQYSGVFLNIPNKDEECIDCTSSKYVSPPASDYVARGFGDYEVVLTTREFKTGFVGQLVEDVFQKEFGIALGHLHQILEANDEIILTSFPTEKAANDYVTQLCKTYGFPNGFTCPHECIFFDPCVLSNGFFDSKEISIALFVPQTTCRHLYEYIDDLKFYMQQVGISNSLFQHMVQCLDIGCPLPEGYLQSEKIMSDFEDDGKSGALIGALGSFIGGMVSDSVNNNEDNNLYVFSKCPELWIENDIYVSGPYSGKAFAYWPKVKFSHRKECQVYINGLEKKLHKAAVKKWGDEYYRNHLCVNLNQPWISLSGSSDYCLAVRNRAHSTTIIYKYENSQTDNLISYTPITGNRILMKACLDYIRNEVEAKEEMKVQTLDFGSTAACEYETDLSKMTIPVGKAETKDAEFRMDLVSHVHSFIIGQSGSGKSVFLHNIIGGAMLKYAPEDLQFYLLDFKLGGVEFNRYKGAKHVKALLVDNSDPQVTLEILRELRGSMAERGKLLRGAGVNNIGEYNKLNPQNRMPHVLVVADECHEMFRDDDSIPRKVRTEISDIVIKIAKEGRSQGVHLVFATQTLSGTDISSEIINNVSDFYLLKCAQTDAERLVPRSSDITSELSTGQIYYHHVDEQVKFQAYYTDKEAAEKLMAAIVEKAKDHKSNGEFYFNGAQLFYLDESVKDQILGVKGKSPVAFLGKAIDISQKDLYIKLNEDFSENVLLLGLNDQEQVTRTTLNLFVSLMMSAKLKHKDIAFKVIDCLNNEEGEVHEQLFDLENAGFCEIIERRQRSKFFKNLAQGVQNGTADETILLILGQDRFRELKMDMELDDDNVNSIPSSEDSIANISAFLDDGGGDYSSGNQPESNIRTYREALNVILDKGPDYGVHTLLQLEKATNLLFEDLITSKMIFQRFKHLILLRSDEMTSSRLSLNDDIHLEKLSSEWERLRAYYYAEESDSYTLFTPYMPSKSEGIINLLKKI